MQPEERALIHSFLGTDARVSGRRFINTEYPLSGLRFLGRRQNGRSERFVVIESAFEERTSSSCHDLTSAAKIGTSGLAYQQTKRASSIFSFGTKYL